MMKMGKRFHCFACGIELNEENSSEEHILLNALGGHLHSPKLLCRKCNSEFGNTADVSLASALNFAASYLDIPRQRGKNQIIRTNPSEVYHLLPGGKPELKHPVINREEKGHKGQIEITARDEDELKTILKGLSRKYPDIDVEEAFKNLRIKREYPDHKIFFPVTFHAKEFFPSIIKTAAEFYIFSGGARENVREVLPFIRSESDVGLQCKYYYPQQALLSGVKEDILHHIMVRGSATEGILYGFVSYFGIIQCLVLLNRHYTGSDCTYSYSYNVMTQEENDEEIAIALTREEVLQAIIKPYEQHINALEEAGREFLQKASRIKRNEIFGKKFRGAWDRTIGAYPEGTVISADMMRAFIDEWQKEMLPWLAVHLDSEKN